MNTRETMLNIAREAILHRAAQDGYTSDNYNPVTDDEGYIVSIINGLHHWCHAYGIEWRTELVRAQELFEEDLREMLAYPIKHAWQPDSKCKKVASPEPPSSAHSRIIPLTKWNAHHDWPPLGGLRHLVFHAKTNGFDKVIRKVGRRVLIDEDAFFDWVKTSSGSL